MKNTNSKTLDALQANIDKARNKLDAYETSTPIQAVVTAKLLDAMPGLVGAIDRAIHEHTGEKVAFVLLCFAAGQAVHATNIHPAAEAVKAVKAFAGSVGE